jgi:hypothetical protein
MIASTQSFPSPDDLQARFMALLPRIQTHAGIYFRYIRCPDRKADLIAETIAVAWRWFRRLAAKGKSVDEFKAAFATIAARHVRSGRRLCGMEKAKDAMSPLAQQRRGFTVGSLPRHSLLKSNILDDALVDNTQTEVPEQVAFRVDFPEWLSTWARKDRKLIDELMLGGRTKDVAEKVKLTPARISQKRREYLADWERFTADPGRQQGTVA